MTKIPFGFFAHELEGLGLYGGEKDFSSATLSSFKKNIGEAVGQKEVLVDVETDKTTVEITSPASGTIASLQFGDGEEWHGDGGKMETSFGALLTPAFGEIEIGEDARLDVGVPRNDKTPIAIERAAEVAQSEKPLSSAVDDSGRDAHDEKSHTEGSTVRAIPATRHLARKHGIDLGAVKGTGPGGTIVLPDIEKAMQECGKTSQKDTSVRADLASLVKEVAGTNVIILRPPRQWKTLAKNIEKGPAHSVVGCGELECSMPWMRLARQNHGNIIEHMTGIRFRPWTIIARAVTVLLARDEFSVLNGYWEARDETVNLYTRVHLGISFDPGDTKVVIDRERGTIDGERLKVLTLHCASELSTPDFFKILDELLNRARAGKITMHDLVSHTFIFNNIGALGHSRGISLLTPYTSGLLNLGNVRNDGRVTLQLFFDHRMCDGSLAARFLTAVAEEATAVMVGQ